MMEKDGNSSSQTDPLLSSRHRLNGVLTDFDWNQSVLATVIARTKAVSPNRLEDKELDPNCIPLASVSFSQTTSLFSTNEFKVADINCLYRIGRIEVVGNTFTFIPAEYPDGEAPSAFSQLQPRYSRLTSDELKLCAIKEGMIFEESVSTDVYAEVASLSYLNALGVEVPGLTPMMYPSDLYERRSSAVSLAKQFHNYCDFELHVIGPEGARLEAKSEIIRIHGQPKEVPTNWYKTESPEAVEMANVQNQTNAQIEGADSSAEHLGDRSIAKMRAAAVAGKVETHAITPHMKWANSNPNDMADITDERVKIIERWTGL